MNLKEIMSKEFQNSAIPLEPREYDEEVMKTNSDVIRRWYEEDSPRKLFFDQLLAYFAPRPIKIIQVGAIEQISLAWRIWSGWSDVHFGHYIKKYGGSLIVVDIDETHLRQSAFLAELFGYADKMSVILGRGATHRSGRFGIP
jgi:hypothetical protein